MTYPRNPKFAIPMRMAGSRLAVVEQDSEEEVLQTASMVLRYEAGQRSALPEYGIRDQALRENGADFNEIRAAVSQWDERADADVFTDDDLEDAIQEVQVEVSDNG